MRCGSSSIALTIANVGFPGDWAAVPVFPYSRTTRADGFLGLLVSDGFPCGRCDGSGVADLRWRCWLFTWES